MGFPSPAMDYQESRLSLDSYCKTGRPGVFLFRSDCTSFREGIRPGSLLIVDFGARPVDGSLVLCILEDEFRIMRLRLHPARCLQELDRPENVRPLPDNEDEGIEIRGVVTHIVTDARSGGVSGFTGNIEMKKHIKKYINNIIYVLFYIYITSKFGSTTPA